MQKQSQYNPHTEVAQHQGRKPSSSRQHSNEPVSSKTPSSSKLVTGLSTDFKNSYSVGPNNVKSTRNFSSMNSVQAGSDQHLRRSHEIQPFVVQPTINGIQGRAEMIARKSQNYVQGAGVDNSSVTNNRA